MRRVAPSLVEAELYDRFRGVSASFTKVWGTRVAFFESYREGSDDPLALEARVAFTLRVQLAGQGDPLDDPTIPWPEDRERITLGRLGINEPHPGERDGEVIVFDPTRVTDGIESSKDRILNARPHAYTVSVERRSAVA